MMPGEIGPTEKEMLSDLVTRFSRVERAILGEPTVGHQGLVTRVEILETAEREASGIHQQIEQNRVDGDKRVHDRVDVVSKKVDRIVYVAAGFFLGGVGTGGSIAWAILENAPPG